jgi:hypothetical protein
MSRRPPTGVNWATRWLAVVLSIGDLIMARRQLLNLKQHAERHQHQSNPSDHSD